MATTVLSGRQTNSSKRSKHKKDKLVTDTGAADKNVHIDHLFSVERKENDCPSEQMEIFTETEMNSTSQEESEMKSSRKKKRSGWKSIKKGVSEFQLQSRKILNNMMTKVRQNSSKRRVTMVENINITPDSKESSGQWAETRRPSSAVESNQSNHSFVSSEKCHPCRMHESVIVVHDMEEESD
ncbi:uncharacterized protein LOC115215853 [Octopus sinensis]|uniref:Uncharacterized protein LOC115215853 n=1 Tax=Octopus sinensis TaxID=2607531 RepID=A0A6P7SSV8_9MOLL|nr:uncharacterized protein LOC115215853 [Octopus sinensis]